MPTTRLNRKKPPVIHEPVEFDIRLPKYEKAVLSNGVEVIQVNMGTEDTLQLNWVFYAGNWQETLKGQAAATNFLLKNGTSNRTAFAINEHFEYYGAYLNRTCYTETAEITLHCLSRHVKQLLPSLAELLTDASFPEEELFIYKQNSKQRLKVGLEKSDFVASRLIDSYLFGEEHPYGKYNLPEDYDPITREQLISFYEKYYCKGRCIIFAAGKLPADLIPLLEASFGHMPLRPHTAHDEMLLHVPQPHAEKKHRVTINPEGIQAAIRLVRPFPNRHHPDFQKAMLLNSLFGGFFGSRLMANIREDKGYTYGIYSYILNHVHDSGWMVSTEAGRDVSEDTIKEVYLEMARLREEPVDAEELQMTRNYMIGSILGDLDGPFQVIARWRSLILNGLTDEFFYRGIDTIKNTSALELQELANRYLQPDDFYELVVV